MCRKMVLTRAMRQRQLAKGSKEDVQKHSASETEEKVGEKASQTFANPAHKLILNQVEFYFSDANYSNDKFLQKQLDSDGFVPISSLLAYKTLALLLQKEGNVTGSARKALIAEVAQKSDIVKLSADGKKLKRKLAAPLATIPTPCLSQ